MRAWSSGNGNARHCTMGTASLHRPNNEQLGWRRNPDVKKDSNLRQTSTSF